MRHGAWLAACRFRAATLPDQGFKSTLETAILAVHYERLPERKSPFTIERNDQENDREKHRPRMRGE
jgi:hypothetical protein